LFLPTVAYTKLQQLPESKHLTRLYAFLHTDYSEMLPIYISLQQSQPKIYWLGNDSFSWYWE